MGELLYLYLEEHGLVEEIARDLTVERNVQLLKREKSSEKAYFEGSRYFDMENFRKYIDCYKYTYTVNTRFTINGEVVFSYADVKSGISVEEEKPFDVYGNENTSMDYYNASGREVVLYQKSNENNEYILKHICYNKDSKLKALKLPLTLRCLLANEESLAGIICRMYDIDLSNYHSELLRRQKILDKIKLIDAQIIRLEKLKNDFLNQLNYGETKITK